jgi:hypothetical protein
MATAIPLSRGLFATVDDADAEWLSQFKWSAQKSERGHHYAHRAYRENGRKIWVKMHRLIMGAEPGQIVDHRNADTLDNRRANLRFCTTSQNMMNARGKGAIPFKGVWRSHNQYAATIKVNGIRHWLGAFRTPEEASEAYDAAAKRLFGEFARSA